MTSATFCVVSGPRGAGERGTRTHVSEQVLAIAQRLYYDVPRLESPGFYSVWSHIHCINLLRFKPFLLLGYGTAVSANILSQNNADLPSI